MLVYGNVTGDVSDSGFGNINIQGDVHGSVTADGMGSIFIRGNVHGEVRSKSYGSVEILGSHLNGGEVVIEGNGRVSVNGVESVSFITKLLRFF